MPMYIPPSGHIDNSPWNAQSKRHYQANIDCERILTEVQNEASFSDWLNEPDETSMLQAGNKGSVIVLTASCIRCNAFIIHRGTIEVVSLSDLDYNEIANNSDSEGPTTTGSLWIWETIATPVLMHLSLSPASSGNCPRLWLIPTGDLVDLPIHAVGDYRHRTSKYVSMLDYAVCSYSLSIKPLILARRRPATIPNNASAVLINDEGNHYNGGLKFVAKETSTLHDIYRSRGLDVAWATHKEGALQALANCTLFHFAAIFCACWSNDLDGSISLEDGKLTIAEILDSISRSSPPFLAYLSGCSTATTIGKKSAGEQGNAAGALYLGGFLYAIGTLGTVSDPFCYGISTLFYRAWSDKALSDDTVALCLHDAVRTCRDRWKAEGPSKERDRDHRNIVLRSEIAELEWAAFVHFGT